MSVLFLTKDLTFFSRVSGWAQASGVKLSVVPEAVQLVAHASRDQARLVLIDLGTPGLNLKQLMPQLRGLACPPEAIIAFGPHVHEAKLTAAREAGCDEVVARGEFSKRMVDLLAKHVTVDHHTCKDAESSNSPGGV